MGFLVLGVLAPGVIFPALGQTPAQVELFERALLRYHSSDLARAREDFERLHRETGRVHFLQYIGNCQLTMGDYAGALDTFRQALEREPGSWELRLGLARTLFHLDLLHQAAEELRHVLRLHPDSVEAIHHLGLLASRKGDHTAALGSFERVLERDPLHVGALYNAGQSSLRLEQPDRAAAYLSRHRELVQELERWKPYPGKYWLAMGKAYLAARVHGRAREALERARLLDPTIAEVQAQLGFVYYELERWEDSIESYLRFLAIAPDHYDARFNLGQAYRRAGMPAQAVDAFQEAAAIRPESPQPFVAVTEVLIEQQAWEGALESTERLTERFPREPYGYHMRARCLLELGRVPEALESARRAVELDPAEPDYRSLLEKMRTP